MLNASRFLLIVFVGLVSAHVRVEGQAIPNEYRLKAAFMYQFPQFVEWPSTTWQDAQSVQLCIASPNPFGSELEQLVRGESLNGRPLSVKRSPVPTSWSVAMCCSWAREVTSQAPS